MYGILLRSACIQWFILLAIKTFFISCSVVKYQASVEVLRNNSKSQLLVYNGEFVSHLPMMPLKGLPAVKVSKSKKTIILYTHLRILITTSQYL